MIASTRKILDFFISTADHFYVVQRHSTCMVILRISNQFNTDSLGRWHPPIIVSCCEKKVRVDPWPFFQRFSSSDNGVFWHQTVIPDKQVIEDETDLDDESPAFCWFVDQVEEFQRCVEYPGHQFEYGDGCW